ncbi:uncharacterized protein SCHCODRAFT_01334661 [Schizophyllum commune H4-8]|nr:uncharacterized protein SCHCODRAFT_01334661 [Schizophyllum commune H4-8]KAI5892984.1 hypothetical protein SCHCODRAFT_01334661 [Schizophyllum commune H4-8]
MAIRAGIVLLCEQLKACQMEIQRDRAKFDFSLFFLRPPRNLPALPRHGPLFSSLPSFSHPPSFIFFIRPWFHSHRSFIHDCDPDITFFLLPPYHVDDVRHEVCRTRPDALIASTATSASSELIVAAGKLVLDPASPTRATCPTPPPCDGRRNTWPQSRRRRDHFALLPEPSVLCDLGVLLSLNDENALIRDGGMPTTDLLCRRVERRATVLIDTQTDVGAYLPDTYDSRNDVGTLSLPPTTILDDLPLVTIAAVPLMRPTRDSQAGEITLDTAARPTIPGTAIAALLVMPEPPDARTDPLDELILVNEAFNLSQTTAEGNPVDCQADHPPSNFLSPPRPLKRATFAEPKPPEACARSLGEGRGRGGGPLPPRYEHFSQIPNRRRHARAPSAKDAAGIFLTPKPPEASACTLGEGCERGGAPLPLARGKGEAILQTPDRRRHARAPSAKEAGRVGHLLPPHDGLGKAVGHPNRRGELFAHPTTSVKPPTKPSRADTREGEALHLRRRRVMTR